MKRLVRVATLMASLTVFATDDACQQFKEAPGQWQSVAENMVMNGVPMTVRQMRSDKKLADLIAFYRGAWTQTGQPAPLEYPLAPWQVIAVARGKCFYTFQVQPQGSGATGLLAISHAPSGVKAAPSGRFPMPGGSNVINDIAHNDLGKTGRTVFLQNGLSLEGNAVFYRDNMVDQGWSVLAEKRVNTPRGPGIVLDLSRQLEQGQLTISRGDGRSYVLFHYMDRP
jgi:hypothetical protein